MPLTIKFEVDTIFPYYMEQLACQKLKRRSKGLARYPPELQGREVKIPCQDQGMSGNDVNGVTIQPYKLWLMISKVHYVAFYETFIANVLRYRFHK